MTPQAGFAEADTLRRDMHQRCQLAVQMLQLTWEGCKTHDVALLQRAAQIGQQLQSYGPTLTAPAVPQSHTPAGLQEVVQELLLAPIELERHRLDQQLHPHDLEHTAAAVQPVTQSAGLSRLALASIHLLGGHLAQVVQMLITVEREGIPFTERAVKELHTLLAKALELLECLRDGLLTQNRILLRYLQTERQRYSALVDEYALSHQQRLIEGVCLPRASSIFVALLDALKGVVEHSGHLAEQLARASTS